MYFISFLFAIAMIAPAFALAQQNHQFKINSVYALDCNDPSGYAFIVRRLSDLYIKFIFDQGALSGAGVVREINMEMSGASFLFDTTSPTVFEKFRFSEDRAKLLTLTIGINKLVEGEKVLANNQDAPTYSICANETKLMSLTITPILSQTLPSVDELSNVKQQFKIYKTAVKFSPELRVEIEKSRVEAEQAKRDLEIRQASEKQRLEEEKAKQEAERTAERKRQEEDRAKKTAEAAALQRAAMAKVKVNGVGLGQAGKLPCQAKNSTYENTLSGQPTMVLFTCEYGVSGDHNEIFFASDKKTVIRVTRKQFLTVSDPSASEIVEKAVGFFGTPAKVDLANWLAIYGDGFSVSYNGKRGFSRRGETGTGLSIKGEICDQFNPCPDSKYKYFVSYELINNEAYSAALKEGEKRLQDQNKSKLNSVTF